MRTGLIAAGLVAAALVLWGGYDDHWSWIGINGSTATLWDWLHLLLLPLAVGVLPIWLSRDLELERRIKSTATVAVVVLAVVVVFGYLIPWAWTGFTGNTLWDWLNLIALPLAVALAPLVRDLRKDWNSRHTTIAVAGSALFVAIVLAGYLIPWAWTGFTGNTLWDWLHLLLLPLLIPILVVPALESLARVHVSATPHDEAPAPPAETGAPDETGPPDELPFSPPAAGGPDEE